MKNWISVIGISLLSSFTMLQAQRNLNLPYEYVKRLPTYNWEGDKHYFYYQAGADPKRGADKILVDVKTGIGKVVEQASRQVSGVNIQRNGDVAIGASANRKAAELKGVENATLSPDSSQIAYTKAGNLFIYNLTIGETTQLTKDGSSFVYNGKSSWIYNEEILGRGTAYRAFWWSPDSKKIAFMRFDESNVPVHYMAQDTGQHVNQIKIHYPLPGDKNPEVKIGLYTVGQSDVVWADYNAEDDQYFGQPFWTAESDELWVQWLNRGQDSLVIAKVNLQTGSKTSLYTETQKTWIAIDQEDRIRFLPKSKQFLLMSDKSGWMHIYLYNRDGQLVRQLTAGDWTVDQIDYIDEKSEVIYFTGKRENSLRKDFYKVHLRTAAVDRLTFGDFTHRVNLSADASYFITTYSNATTAERIALMDNKGKLIRELGDSKGKDFERIHPKAARSEVFRIRTPDGFDLPLRLFFPANFDPARKHGLLTMIYGGPNSGTVSDGFSGGFGDPLGDTTAMIRVMIDHRGSGHFGKLGQNFMHRNLGDWEIKDYAFVVEELKKRYPCIDATRVGIKGFSYGGYISILALLKAPEVFTVGLAGGSVTDWRFYDSAYTERFMDTPAENPEGYQRSSALYHAKNLSGKLSMVQGTMDDNVHQRNTLRMVDALQEAGKEFHFMLYPGAAHGWFYLHNKSRHSSKEEKDFITKYLVP